MQILYASLKDQQFRHRPSHTRLLGLVGGEVRLLSGLSGPYKFSGAIECLSC